MERSSHLTFMKGIDVAAMVLLVIGGLNWGLVGFFGVDIVSSLFGSGSVLTRLIFCLVGLAAIYEIFAWRAVQRRWGCQVWPGSPAHRSAV